MTAKQLFAALGILLAILSFVFTGGALHLVAGGVISIGVAILIP
jgi:hypothetical protein